MNYHVPSEDRSEGSEHLNKLIQEEKRLRTTIEVVRQSLSSLEQSALSAERSNHGHLNPEREAWIRATVRSKDQVFLDSPFIDLERVTKQIASLTPPD